MSDHRRFLKGLTSLPLATVLASPCVWRIRRMPGKSAIFIVLQKQERALG